jgi:hypothetical protein
MYFVGMKMLYFQIADFSPFPTEIKKQKEVTYILGFDCFMTISSNFGLEFFSAVAFLK